MARERRVELRGFRGLTDSRTTSEKRAALRVGMQTERGAQEWSDAVDYVAGDRYLLRGGPFRMEVDDPAYPFTLTLDVSVEYGRLVCDRVEARRRPGSPPITTSALRIPLGAYLDGALAMHPKIEPAGTGYVASTDERLDAYANIVRRERKVGRERLEQVVAAYRQAREELGPRGAVSLVCNREHLSRGYVSKLLSEARDAGLLRPDEIGVGGQPKKRAPKKTTRRRQS
jgi:hypothetical protein